MGEFVIEKGVPVPPVRPPAPQYPFAEMAVGDSFDAGEWDRGVATRLGSAISNHRKRHGGHFSQRKVDGRIRVWRIA